MTIKVTKKVNLNTFWLRGHGVSVDDNDYIQGHWRQFVRPLMEQSPERK